jgi:hypothetical protein
MKIHRRPSDWPTFEDLNDGEPFVLEDCEEASMYMRIVTPSGSTANAVDLVTGETQTFRDTITIHRRMNAVIEWSI